jgi:hypothetical protein
MEIHSFSGTHAWHPTVLLDTDAYDDGNADEIIYNIEHGQCPRCERALPEPPEFPAGSRVTLCRSIPICGRCGSDEAYEQWAGAQGGYGLSSAGEWPIPTADIDERRARYEQQMTPAILTGDGHLITEDGAAPIVNPCNTGGWAQVDRREAAAGD